MTIEYFVTEPFVLDIINYVKQDTFTIKVKDLALHPETFDIGFFTINYLEQDFKFIFPNFEPDILKMKII